MIDLMICIELKILKCICIIIMLVKSDYTNANIKTIRWLFFSEWSRTQSTEWAPNTHATLKPTTRTGAPTTNEDWRDFTKPRASTTSQPAWQIVARVFVFHDKSPPTGTDTWKTDDPLPTAIRTLWRKLSCWLPFCQSRHSSIERTSENSGSYRKI